MPRSQLSLKFDPWHRKGSAAGKKKKKKKKEQLHLAGWAGEMQLPDDIPQLCQTGKTTTHLVQESLKTWM